LVVGPAGQFGGPKGGDGAAAPEVRATPAVGRIEGGGFQWLGRIEGSRRSGDSRGSGNSGVARGDPRIDAFHPSESGKPFLSTESKGEIEGEKVGCGRRKKREEDEGKGEGKRREKEGEERKERERRGEREEGRGREEEGRGGKREGRGNKEGHTSTQIS
jgi:hypothetical protein